MTEQMPKPGAVHFRPCNSEQIRSRAEKDIRAELKGSTSIASWACLYRIILLWSRCVSLGSSRRT